MWESRPLPKIVRDPLAALSARGSFFVPAPPGIFLFWGWQADAWRFEERKACGEGEPFSGRLSNELHRKQDTLFPQLLDSRKITELLSWAVVYESHRPCYLFIGQPGKIPPSGKELPQQAVALFVQRTFSRTARMAEVTFYLKGLIDLPEAEEFLAPVIGQGMPIACGDAGKQLLQTGRDALHVSRPAKCSHEKAAFAFHSRQDIA